MTNSQVGVKLCVKTSANLCVNHVEFSVNKLYCPTFTHFLFTFLHIFTHLSHLLLDNLSTSILINTFTHFHTTYYYNYDFLIINNYNRKD